VRVLWLLAPVTAGPALSHRLAAASTGVATTAAVLAWTGWTLTLVALLVPRAISVTVVRVTAPAALAAAIVSAWGRLGAASALALAWAAVTTVVALSAPVADFYVDGSSYGPERRMILRTPGPLLLGPVELAWAAVVAGLSAGPLLLAAREWVAGGVSLVVGWPLAFVAARAMHQLSRRWFVFVPGGLVLHDRLALAEPMLFPRALVAVLGPAPVDSGATDTTMNALGLALELRLRQPVDLLVRAGRRGGTKVDTEAVLFTPARPGTLLNEARSRRLPVG
jgi:hypothetical protein